MGQAQVGQAHHISAFLLTQALTELCNLQGILTSPIRYHPGFTNFIMFIPQYSETDYKTHHQFSTSLSKKNYYIKNPFLKKFSILYTYSGNYLSLPIYYHNLSFILRLLHIQIKNILLTHSWLLTAMKRVTVTSCICNRASCRTGKIILRHSEVLRLGNFNFNYRVWADKLHNNINCSFQN